MARETPEQKVRREQRELMERLNAERDKKLTTRQQNDMRMRGATPTTTRSRTTPQVTVTTDRAPLGGAAGRARSAIESRNKETAKTIEQIDRGTNRGGSRGRR